METMIPKVIHYCWFGGKPLPPLGEKCIASWRKYLPGYDIREWNETNFDVNAIPYTRQAYAEGKYAFVSDYARFWILYHEGGLYFDTDVEIIRPIDDIVQSGPFMGMETDGADGILPTVAPGLGLGARPAMPLYRRFLDLYESLTFDSQRPATVVDYATDLLRREGLIACRGNQHVAGVNIYASTYFNPRDITTKRFHITSETRSIHHYAASWADKDWRWHAKKYLRRLVPESLLRWYHDRKVSATGLSQQVLFVGIDYRHPNGGMAMVINSYAGLFHPFKFVALSAGDSMLLLKLWRALRGYALLFFRLLADRHIRIVHVHSASGMSFWRKSLAIRMAHTLGKRVVFHCHGGGFSDFRASAAPRVDAVIRQCDAIIALSPQWQSYFQEAFPDKPVVVVNNPIPLPQVIPADDDGRVHFLFLGRICRNKGIYDLVDVIAAHQDELRGKMILHVGGNDETEQLRRKVTDSHIADIVSIEGWVAGERKTQLLNRADVLILPSYIEALPISILEAESYGKAVIATPVGGIPSIVTDGVNGILVSPGDKEQLFTAISTLISQPALRQQMGAAGKAVSADHLPDHVARQLCELYRQLLPSDALRQTAGEPDTTNSEPPC